MPPRRLTKGFEEEVYTGTWRGDVVGLSHRISAALPDFSTEPDARNIEFTTEPFRDYEVLLSHLMTKRCRLRRYLREIGNYTLVPGSTIPLGDTREFHLSDPDNPYYVFIRDSYGTNVVTASHHVNVGIDDMDALFRAYRVLRLEAPMFLALTATSPFFGGEVTGFHSTRWGLFPKTPPAVPFFADHAEFVRWVEARLADGAMYNARHLWISARPNGPVSPYELNRVEMRITERIACPRLLVAVAAFLEARVWEVLESPGLDPLRRSSSAELEALALANEAAAARHSLDATVTDWSTGRPVAMRSWILGRLAASESIAQRHRLVDYLAPIGETVEEGNQAQRWLELVGRGWTPRRVMIDAVAEAAEIDKAVMGAECA
ncbi:MAG TPA: glutamate--cysteine ligase [Thermoanaerobaculia bacterium]|nr:glutamate--cysteine ligase [Thermoanaerobaculia bacterium]